LTNMRVVYSAPAHASIALDAMSFHADALTYQVLIL